MMKKFNYSPKDCPFLFKNVAPDGLVYIFFTPQRGYRFHAEGYGNMSNLWNALNGFWSTLKVDNHTVHMSSKDDIKPKFLNHFYKPEDFDLSKVYKIVADDENNSLQVITKHYKAHVDKLKRKHIPVKQQIKRDLICDRILIYAKEFQKLTVPFYERLARLMTYERNYDEVIFIQDMLILYSFYLVNKDNINTNRRDKDGLAPKMLNNTAKCFDLNVIFNALAHKSWKTLIKQIHKSCAKTNSLLGHEIDRAGYLTSKEIKLIKKLQLNIDETFSDFEFSATSEELKPYFELSEGIFQDWQSRIAPNAEKLFGTELKDVSEDAVADRAAKIKNLNNMSDDEFRDTLLPID